MIITDWLRRLFGLRSRKDKATAAPAATAPPTVTIPAPERVPVNLPFTIRPDMINTLSFSADLNEIFLIDNGRLITFDLRNGDGVTIGLLNGQLSVVSTHVPPKPATDVDDLRDTGSGDRVRSGRSRTSAAINEAKPTAIRLEVLARNQFTITYNEASRALGLIGATDIISTITDPGHGGDPVGNCELHLISLEGQTANLKRQDNVVVVTTMELA